MILKFSKNINSKPTNFVEKIWKCLKEELSIELHQKFSEKLSAEEQTKPYKMDGEIYTKVLPKLHTIREDPADKWIKSEEITFVIKDGMESEPEIFAPNAFVVNTQKIAIEWLPGKSENDITKPVVWIDDKIFFDAYFNFGRAQMRWLANNDGFEDIDGFFNYFKENFTGKIIHWTELKY